MTEKHMDDHRQPVVLSVDIGGSHVKILTSAGGAPRRVVSGPDMDAAAMADAVEQLAQGLPFDVISIGYPGPVVHDRIVAEPHNLAHGWVAYDFARRFGKPLKIVNDALMQAVGSYDGGRMLFLGLGTGRAGAMVANTGPQPRETAHPPSRRGRTFEDSPGNGGLEGGGGKKWEKHPCAAVEKLTQALEPDYVVIGGGNAAKLHRLPEKSRRGDNMNAFKGGFALWLDRNLRV